MWYDPPMTKSQEFVFGWCAADNHQHCRGAIRRPPQDGPDGPVEAVQLCTCHCHAGQDVAPPEEYQRPLTQHERLAKEVDGWFSNLVVHQHLDIPCPPEDKTSITNRIRGAAKKGGVVIKTRYWPDQAVLKVTVA